MERQCLQKKILELQTEMGILLLAASCLSDDRFLASLRMNLVRIALSGIDPRLSRNLCKCFPESTVMISRH
jgi:hypothetical protein